MMRLLAFDTSSKSGALVALEWEFDTRDFSAVRLAAEWSLNVDASFHSEKLLWAVDQLLEAAGWKLADVGIFGVGVGPGSFTGLRIGMTTARTLAKTLGRPLVGVSSLAALARPVAGAIHAGGAETLIVAATDACKGEVFALYGEATAVSGCVSHAEGGHPGLWQEDVEECVVSPSDLIAVLRQRLAASRTLKWVAIGEARHRYPEIWKELPGNRELKLAVPFRDAVQGRYLGMLAWQAAAAGLARDPLSVHPRYLRVSDAELKLKAGLLPPGPVRG